VLQTPVRNRGRTREVEISRAARNNLCDGTTLRGTRGNTRTNNHFVFVLFDSVSMKFHEGTNLLNRWSICFCITFFISQTLLLLCIYLRVDLRLAALLRLGEAFLAFLAVRRLGEALRLGEAFLCEAFLGEAFLGDIRRHDERGRKRPLLSRANLAGMLIYYKEEFNIFSRSAWMTWPVDQFLPLPSRR
jgi:hypothetical protein